MGKASSVSYVDASTDYNTVFIDTNLDTHLAMIVSDSDTASDLKKKIMDEHPLCFPDIGEIKVHALKVKRKGYFFHLADSMFVRRAFDGVKKNWFLCADASSLVKQTENSLSRNPAFGNLLVCSTNNPSSADRVDLLPERPSPRLTLAELLREFESSQYGKQKVPYTGQFSLDNSMREVSKDLEMEVKHLSGDSSSDTNKRANPELQEKYELISEQNEVLRTHSEHKEENSWNGTSDMQCSDYVEDASKIGSVVRKKHKIRKKNKNAVADHALIDKVASIDTSRKDASQQGTIILQNFLANAGKEVSNDMRTGTKHTSDEPCRSSSSGLSKRLESGLQKKYQLGNETEVPVTRVEFKNDKSTDKTVDEQCNNLLREASPSGPPAKKKHKIKRKNSVEDPSKEKEALIWNSSEETSKPENMMPENSLEDKQNGTDAANVGLSAEPPQDVPSSGLSKRLESGIQKKYDLCHETEVPIMHVEFKNDKPNDRAVDVQCNNLLREASQSGPVAKKERKTKKKKGWENPSKEKEALICNSSKETSKPENMIPEKSLEDEQNRTEATNAGLSTKPPQDVHLVENSSSSRNRKRKRTSSGPHNQVLAAVPSSVRDVQEESSMETVGFNPNDSGKGSVAAVVPGRSSHVEKHSDSDAISLKEKHNDTVQEDAGMSDVDAGHVESKGDASDVSRRKSSKKHHAVDAKDHPPVVVKDSNNLDKGTSLSGHDNIVSDDHHKFRTDQAHKIGQEKELLQNGNSEAMLSEKCKPSSRNETERNNKEVVVSSKLLDSNGLVEPENCASKRKKSKKAKSSVTETQVTSGLEQPKGPVSGISSTEPHRTFKSDHATDEAAKEASILSQTEKNNVSKIKTVNANLSSTDGEADEVSGNEVEPLQQTQINRSQEDPVHVDGKVRKKTRKKRAAAENLPDAEPKEQDVSPKDLTPSSNITRETRLMETSSKDQLNESNLEPGKEVGIETESFHPQHISQTVDSSQVRGRPLQANVDGNPPISSPAVEAAKNMEVSISESERINFKDYFVPSQDQHEDVSYAEALDDKVMEAKKSGSEMKAKKNLKVTVHSLGTSLDLQNSIKSNDSRRSEKKIQGGNSSTIHESLSKDESGNLLPKSKSSKEGNTSTIHGSLSKNESGDLLPKSKPSKGGNSSTIHGSLLKDETGNLLPKSKPSKVGNSSTIHGSLSKDESGNLLPRSKSSKVSKNGVETRPSNDTAKFDPIPEEPRRLNIVKASGTRRPASAYSKENIEGSIASSSSLGNSENRLHKRRSCQDGYHTMAEKASGNNIGKVVDSSNHEKSLLAISGNIFKDGNSESSEGDGVEDSDASTRTPSNASTSTASDDSSSSDRSEVENKANLHTPATGSYGTKRKDVGNKSILKSVSSGVMDVSLDTILKSSSRFKKAKLKASQSQVEDTESQPVDFVPDSQAN